MDQYQCSIVPGRLSPIAAKSRYDPKWTSRDPARFLFQICVLSISDLCPILMPPRRLLQCYVPGINLVSTWFDAEAQPYFQTFNIQHSTCTLNPVFVFIHCLLYAKWSMSSWCQLNVFLPTAHLIETQRLNEVLFSPSEAESGTPLQLARARHHLRTEKYYWP
jgi:hypothetical protein